MSVRSCDETAGAGDGGLVVANLSKPSICLGPMASRRALASEHPRRRVPV